MVSSVPCSCTFCSIGLRSFAIFAASRSSGSRFFIRSSAAVVAANIFCKPFCWSISLASLVQIPTRSSMLTPGTPWILPRSHTTRPSPSQPESSGPHCAFGMGNSGVMSMIVSAISPLWFASTSEFRGITMPSSSISISTSTFSRDGLTDRTLPTFTPRTRTVVPTWMPHAKGNSTNAWYDRSLLKLRPRIHWIVSAVREMPPRMKRPTPPSQTLVLPKPKSRRGLIVCAQMIEMTDLTVEPPPSSPPASSASSPPAPAPSAPSAAAAAAATVLAVDDECRVTLFRLKPKPSSDWANESV
mmetsp:Transcript_7588/g.29947  ORF Transcript_7588/g.29947 Transcript_7588/m.29947 type:complete len:300 (+) Transcript_7588:624-1523(+)